MLGKLISLAALLIALSASHVQAAAITMSGGELTGATGVNVNGTLWDVVFVDGTCASSYAGCNATSDFAFTNATDAAFASQALLDQVFLNSASGNFDSSPALLAGCSSSSSCTVYTPYSVGLFLGFIPVFNASGAVNSSGSGDGLTNDTFLPGRDFGGESRETLARWSQAQVSQQQPVATPEPATLLLVGAGLSAARFARRRRK